VYAINKIAYTIKTNDLGKYKMTFTLKRKAPNPNGNPNFKPRWKLGNTIAIRIPEAIADLVISVARKIDNGGFNP